MADLIQKEKSGDQHKSPVGEMADLFSPREIWRILKIHSYFILTLMIGSVGMLRRLLEELKAFVRRTTRDGRRLGTIPWVRRALADLEMRVEVGRRIGLLNAWLIDQGTVPTKEGSISKIYVTELNAHVASAGLEILGLAGQLAPTDPAAPLHGRLQWLYTIAPMQRFGGGTNEIQRIIIADRGLGLPRK